MAAENICSSYLKQHITTSQDGHQDIKPGLIGLNLNIMQALDMHIIQDAKLIRIKLVDKEHFIVKNVQENMIALLKWKIPREKREGRLILERILEMCPNNLNVLADLEYVYRELNRRVDADQCKSAIERIMRSKKKDDMQCKQICLLEQGFALLSERTIFNKSTVEQRITDLARILNIEQERSEGIRQQCLERGLHHQMQVLRNIQNANDEDAKDGHIVRKGSSLQKFEIAEKSFLLPFPHIVWEFYHAKVLNQYYDSLEVLSKFKQELDDEKLFVTITAVEKFWRISQYRINPNMRTYIARSYAYIGHILMKSERKSLIVSKENELGFIKQARFQKFLADPLAASEMAFKIQQNDITVLNRYGRSLWNKSHKIKDFREKLECLQNAEGFLTESITNDNNRNWFAHSTRMFVRLKISDIYLKTSNGRHNNLAMDHLHKAKDDGLECFKSQTTQRDMNVLAEVLQRLAKFPNTHKYGREYVCSPDYLHQALDYLFFATHLGAPLDFYWTHRTASCLFDLGEIENAIEWQRKTWFLSSPSNSNSFYILCLFMITWFEKKSKMQLPVDQFLREFLYNLIYAKSKYKDMTRTKEKTGETVDLFKDNMSCLLMKKRDGLLKLLKAIINEKTITLRESEKQILIECFDIWIKICRDNLEEFYLLKTELKELPLAKENEYVLFDNFKETSLRPLAKSIKPCSKDFTYDFFVSHSHKDQDWVVNILLRHLESKIDDEEVAFKGCIADRDFVPGVSVLNNTLDAIKRSHKVILILTKHFVSSNWCDYEATPAIIKSLDLESEELEQREVHAEKSCAEKDAEAKGQKRNVLESEKHKTNPENVVQSSRSKNRNCVIPVVLEDCKIPDKIKHLNYIDMTDKKDFIEQMIRLKKALLPGEN